MNKIHYGELKEMGIADWNDIETAMNADDLTDEQFETYAQDSLVGIPVCYAGVYYAKVWTEAGDTEICEVVYDPD